MPQHIEGIQTVSLHVTDFPKSRRFYEDAFGLEEMMGDEERGWAMFQVPSGVPLGIHRWADCKDAGGRPPGTVTGVVFTVDDAHAFAEHVQQSGGKLTDPVEELPWGPLGGTVADLDGNEFAFSEPPEQ